MGFIVKYGSKGYLSSVHKWLTQIFKSIQTTAKPIKRTIKKKKKKKTRICHQQAYHKIATEGSFQTESRHNRKRYGKSGMKEKQHKVEICVNMVGCLSPLESSKLHEASEGDNTTECGYQFM